MSQILYRVEMFAGWFSPPKPACLIKPLTGRC